MNNLPLLSFYRLFEWFQRDSQILQADFMAFHMPITTDKIKHYFVVTICVGIVAYFICHGIMGEKGFIALSNVEYQISDAKSDLKKIQTEREKLEARTRLLRPDGLDLDMLDERARATLGYTKPNDYVVLYNDRK